MKFSNMSKAEHQGYPSTKDLDAGLQPLYSPIRLQVPGTGPCCHCDFSMLLSIETAKGGLTMGHLFERYK